MTSTLDLLDEVSLAEINTRAGLTTRTDRKYIVSRYVARDLVAGFGGQARVLSIAGAREQMYSTLYFDDPSLLTYRLAAAHRRRRFKLRARHYLATGAMMLEVKVAGPRSQSQKHRLEIDRLALDVDGRRFAADVLAHYRICADLDAFRPALDICYSRSTFYMPGDEARFTIDTHLTWRDARNAIAANPVAIVETKSPTSRPTRVDRWLWARHYRPLRVSKYATGISALYPNLPGARWARAQHLLQKGQS